ncbi:MAG: histidinol dehydrogenase [Eggerthellaceae bacterium]|nr:histidinol dehydrogenase [Eggerthellaceae bacterium]
MIKIIDAKDCSLEEIVLREEPTSQVEDVVSEIINHVKMHCDVALAEYSRLFDGVELCEFKVSQEEINKAFIQLDEDLLAVINEAASNIEAFHEKQKLEPFEIKKGDGIVLGQRVLPLDKSGIYVPGGTAAYPSTVLMNAIPAKIAGVGEIIMCTPPNAKGHVNPSILAAAKIAGVDKIFKIGGAQAIAALAYGTESVPKVDKIVGPGNAYVAEAKRQVYGLVSIDMIAGPSEILIISDKKSKPAYLAADLLSQAEHDKIATAVLLTTSAELAEFTAEEIEKQLTKLGREEIARASVENNSKIIVCQNLEQAVEISNALAPEHLEICVDEPFELLKSVRHAGSVFLGRSCPEAAGDYFAGPNHTLPTQGTARFYSPLNVNDFIKTSQYCYFHEDAFAEYAEKIATFADAEGLDAHANSALIRLED